MPTGRAFEVAKTHYPWKLDTNGDGQVSDDEAAAAGRVLFKGVHGLSGMYGPNNDHFDLSTELAKEIDRNSDLVIEQEEHLLWLEEEIRMEQQVAGKDVHSEL